jgi:hypothetical protein
MKQTRGHRIALALLSLPLAAALAACGAGGASDDKASAGDAPMPAAENSLADGRMAADSLSGGDTDSAKAVSAESVIQRAVIATGELRLSTRQPADVRQDAINLANELGGHVANEQSESDSHGRVDRVDLTLRVPSASFDKALDGLADLGTVRNRQQSVEDVTTQVIDNEARVKAQSASVASIERLLARATTIGEIMSVEHQLASRQAELDSLKQQQKWLSDQTSLSTIQLTLTRPEAKDSDSDSGFLSGLDDGWHALGRTAVALGTAVGAVLPFAAVIALIGVPAWAVFRRRRTAAPVPEA